MKFTGDFILDTREILDAEDMKEKKEDGEKIIFSKTVNHGVK